MLAQIKITLAGYFAGDRFREFRPVGGCLAILRSRLAGIRLEGSRLGGGSFVERRVEIRRAVGHLWRRSLGGGRLAGGRLAGGCLARDRLSEIRLGGRRLVGGPSDEFRMRLRHAVGHLWRGSLGGDHFGGGRLAGFQKALELRLSKFAMPRFYPW